MREDEEKHKEELKKVERLAYYDIKYGFPAMVYVCIISAFLLSGKLFLIISFLPVIIVLSIALYADFKQKQLFYKCWSTFDGPIRLVKSMIYLIIHGLIILIGIMFYIIFILNIHFTEMLFSTMLVPSSIMFIILLGFVHHMSKKVEEKWEGMGKKYFKISRDSLDKNIGAIFSARKISYQFSTTMCWMYFKGYEPYTYKFPEYNLELNIHLYGKRKPFVTIGKITDSNRAFAQQLKQIVDEATGSIFSHNINK